MNVNTKYCWTCVDGLNVCALNDDRRSKTIKRSTSEMFSTSAAAVATAETRKPDSGKWRKMKPVWVLAHESMEFLGRAIVDCCTKWQTDVSKTVQDFETRAVHFKPILDWKMFPDGFPNLFINNVKEMAGKDVIFVASFSDPAKIFAEISMLYELPRYLANSLTVLLPYFPTGTMERIDYEGQVATAKTLAIILSQIPSTARGPAQIMIFDIHALQERFYFSGSVIPRLETAVPLLIEEIQHTLRGQQVCIAFPDEGAHKRFAQFFPADYERVICSKTRMVADKRRIKIREGDPKGKHVVIVDDLVQTGGTLIEAIQVLKQSGATAVSAYVTHAVFPKESWKKFVTSSIINNEVQLLEHFWITNSIPHSVEIAKHKPFKLLSLAPLIAQNLLGFDLRQWD